ncbi:Thermophilic metalloprotease (M29) [Phycisphaerae bacterium RAS1]|nr:Thermophilic metalloprotease (M29) [Phycisphaerae bacterium RAS1]
MKKHLRPVALVLAAVCISAAVAQPPTKPGASDPAATAQTLVTRCAGIHPGETVLISGSPRDLELLENIAVEVRKLGAFPLLTIDTERLIKKMYADVPAKHDQQEPKFAMKLAEFIDAQIDVEVGEAVDPLAGVAPQRILDTGKAMQAVHDRMLKRGVVSVHLGNNLYPTKARAALYGVPQETLAKIFWSGVDCDYAALQKTGRSVRDKLAAGKSVKITAPNGTDLTVQIGQRPVYVSDGVISTEDRSEGGPACQAWLPAGEVYLAAAPGTATGTFIADTFFHEGTLIEGLKLEFKNGKLTSFTAAKGDLGELKKRYEAAPAGRDDFAAIDIGVNPNVSIPAGSKMVSWVAAGTITVGFGGNAWAGGENTCPFEVSCHLNGGTLTADGTPVVEKGALK